jgi:hypothetical protein
MDVSPEARRRRAAERAANMTRLAPGEDVPLPPPGLPRLELAFELSKAAWLMSGRPWPEIPRDQLPIRRVRSGDEDG